MRYRLTISDYDVIYQGLSQSLRHTEKRECAYMEDAESVYELIEMAKRVLENLSSINIEEYEGE